MESFDETIRSCQDGTHCASVEEHSLSSSEGGSEGDYGISSGVGRAKSSAFIFCWQ